MKTIIGEIEFVEYSDNITEPGLYWFSCSGMDIRRFDGQAWSELAEEEFNLVRQEIFTRIGCKYTIPS